MNLDGLAISDRIPSDAVSRWAASYVQCAESESQRWAAIESAGVRNWADAFEASATRHAARLAVVEADGDSSYRYDELNRAADRVAAWAIALGEPVVALNKENSFAFLAGAIGLAKAGVVAVLLNIQDPNEWSAKRAIAAGASTVLGKSLPGLKAAPSIESLLTAPHPGNIPAAVRRGIQLDDPCWIIFTSGTTGSSKGARFSHRRMIGAGIAWSLRTGMVSDDRCYIALPLHHGNALAVGFSTCVEAGAATVLRERFSVRAFVDDIRRHRCTAAVYIGELWRYLDRTPATEDDGRTTLRVVFGNGLDRDIWNRTVERFGISHVVEHYGATELPAAALTNWTNRPGFCGYIPPNHPDQADVALIDSAGRQVSYDVAGELVLRVKNGVYRGYVDPADDENKVIHNLFAPGDLWWRSGDLLSLDKNGFFTFVERIGDGYRWKGENVAAVEVENAIRETNLVKETTVFGITLPHHDGKAGMASLVANAVGTVPDLGLLYTLLQRSLPSYAIPRLLWIRWDEHPTTATLKIPKATLAAQALDAIADRYILDDGCYKPLTTGQLEALLAGGYSLA